MDIGSAVGRELGVTEEQLRDLPRYRESEAFSEEERLVIDLAVEMSRVPVKVSPELTEELRIRLDEAQLVELTASIAWENYRARFNRVFEVRPMGFSEGAFCALTEHPERSTPPRSPFADAASPNR
jgi:alkylhydroperoxidase family enzyme